jgi:hypothetical protein
MEFPCDFFGVGQLAELMPGKLPHSAGPFQSEKDNWWA